MYCHFQEWNIVTEKNNQRNTWKSQEDSGSCKDSPEKSQSMRNNQQRVKKHHETLYQCPIPQTRPSWEHWVMLNKGRSPKFNITSVLSKAWFGYGTLTLYPSMVVHKKLSLEFFESDIYLYGFLLCSVSIRFIWAIKPHYLMIFIFLPFQGGTLTVKGGPSRTTRWRIDQKRFSNDFF